MEPVAIVLEKWFIKIADYKITNYLFWFLNDWSFQHKIDSSWKTIIAQTSKKRMQKLILVIHIMPPSAMQLYLYSNKREGGFLPVNDRQVKNCSTALCLPFLWVGIQPNEAGGLSDYKSYCRLIICVLQQSIITTQCWPDSSCQVTPQPLIPAIKPNPEWTKTLSKQSRDVSLRSPTHFPSLNLLFQISFPTFNLPHPSLLFVEVRGRYVLVQVRTRRSAAHAAGRWSWHHCIPQTLPRATAQSPSTTTKHHVNAVHLISSGCNLNSAGMLWEGRFPFFWDEVSATSFSHGKGSRQAHLVCFLPSVVCYVRGGRGPNNIQEIIKGTVHPKIKNTRFTSHI